MLLGVTLGHDVDDLASKLQPKMTSQESAQFRRDNCHEKPTYG